MTTFIALVLGILPSAIWLSFYLRKDRHPEPNATVLFVFVMGILIAPIAIAVEYYFGMYVDGLSINDYLKNLVIIFVTIALTEEVLKYLAVRMTMLRNSEFDEPIDAMLYLIIAALGFAAAENTITLFSLNSGQYAATIGNVIAIGVLRFWGATFLHTLTSGLVGYYLALSLRKKGVKSRFMVAKGVIIATLIHGTFNYLLFNANNFYLLFVIPFIMIVSALFVFKCIKILKKKLSICEI
jgi:protease PrsW